MPRRAASAWSHSWSVTTKAECANGVLHTHFWGIDEFVAELYPANVAEAGSGRGRRPWQTR
ncbi:hypothetical protein AB0P15_28305 [Streptomyces sp. NPDC087917]|uniref:hypothetical protein n=1 Tax=Streptomyces sp. NPDC087917 TaxID=3155060 RepID=UPI003419497C